MPTAFDINLLPPTPTMASSGSTATAGAADLQIPVAESAVDSAVADAPIADTINLQIPIAQVSSDGVVAAGGIADLQMPVAQVFAEGIIAREGEADLQMPVAQVFAEGFVSREGSGNLQMPVAQLSAEGDTGREGDGDLVMPVAQVTASGEVARSGEAALTMPVPEMTSGGETSRNGGGSLQMPMPTMAALGTAVPTANVDISIPVPQMIAVGHVGRVGSGSLTAPTPTLESDGSCPFVGVANLVAPTPELTSTATGDARTGDGSLGMPAALANIQGSSEVSFTTVNLSIPFDPIFAGAFQFPFQGNSAMEIGLDVQVAVNAVISPPPDNTGTGDVQIPLGVQVTASLGSRSVLTDTEIGTNLTIQMTSSGTTFFFDHADISSDLQTPVPQMSAEGVVAFGGSADLQAPTPTMSSQGTEAFIGSGNLMAAVAVMSTAGSIPAVGQGDLLMPSPFSQNFPERTGSGDFQAPTPFMTSSGSPFGPPVTALSAALMMPTCLATSDGVSLDLRTGNGNLIAAVAQMVADGSHGPPTFSANAFLSTPVATSFSLGLSRDFLFDPLGRKRIAVDQPQGGSTYPFFAFSDDLNNLIADLYLTYEDPTCQFVRPFHIAWIYGFGITQVPNPGGFPNPTHTSDMIVRDALGQTVFDSTTATFYSVQPWGNRFRVHEWRKGRDILRAVQFTAFGENDTPVDFPTYIVPTEAILHERTLEQIVHRLVKLRVGLQEFELSDVEFVGGYNVEIIVEQGNVEEGERRTNLLTFDAAPGGGLGKFPGCDDVEQVIRTLNNVRPTDGGHFSLDGDGCYRIQRPATLVSSGPPPLYSLTDSNALQIFMDCGPCCSCDDFVNVYRALTNVRETLNDLRIRSEDARDQHQANIDRWDEAKECRENNALQGTLLAICGCRAAIGVQYCNLTDQCIGGAMKFTFAFSTLLLPLGSGILNGSVFKQETTDTTFHNDILYGSWPNFSLIFSKGMNPGTSIRGRFDTAFASCVAGSSVVLTVKVFNGGNLRATRVLSLSEMVPNCGS